jgi:hypothetical protein
MSDIYTSRADVCLARTSFSLAVSFHHSPVILKANYEDRKQFLPSSKRVVPFIIAPGIDIDSCVARYCQGWKSVSAVVIRPVRL